MAQAQNMDAFRNAVRKSQVEAERRQTRMVQEIAIGDQVFPNWRPKETTSQLPDANVIRIGPPNGEGNELCFITMDEHSMKIGDEFVRFWCPRTGGADAVCPACVEQYALFKASRETGNAEDKARSDEMRSRTVAVFAILDKHDPVLVLDGGRKVPKWQLLKIGAGLAGAGRSTTFTKLSGKFDRFGDFSHPQTGRWVRVVYTIGTDPVTKKKSARMADWDFEPLDPPSALPKGYDVGLPDLRDLRNELPTEEQILELLGMPAGESAEFETGPETGAAPGEAGGPEELTFGEPGGEDAGTGAGEDDLWGAADEEKAPARKPAGKAAKPAKRK